MSVAWVSPKSTVMLIHHGPQVNKHCLDLSGLGRSGLVVHTLPSQPKRACSCSGLSQPRLSPPSYIVFSTDPARHCNGSSYSTKTRIGQEEMTGSVSASCLRQLQDDLWDGTQQRRIREAAQNQQWPMHPVSRQSTRKEHTRAPTEVYSTHCCSQTLHIVLLGTAQIFQDFPRYHCHTSHHLQIQENALNYICEHSRAHRKKMKKHNKWDE